MRCVLSAVFVLALGAVPALAQGDPDGAYGQLQNATSGNQTLDQTYGDSNHGPGCPDACPTANTNVPDPGPPQRDDSANQNGSDNDSSDSNDNSCG